MSMPQSAGKVKRITGAPPGYAYGRPSATAGFGGLIRQLGTTLSTPMPVPVGTTETCTKGQYLAVMSDPNVPIYCAANCPAGWPVKIDTQGGPNICYEPGMEPQGEGTAPKPAAPQPVAPAAPPPPSAPAPVQPRPALAPAAQSQAPAGQTGIPTWAFIGAGAALVLVVGAIALT